MALPFYAAQWRANLRCHFAVTAVGSPEKVPFKGMHER